MPYRQTILLLTVIMILLTACGTRGIPAIRQEQMANKLSILMITSPKLSDSAKQMIGTKLLDWRNTNQIAYDWMKDAAAVDDAMMANIESKPYDYIYVIGTELFPTVIQSASADKNSKWILLQDQLDVQLQTPLNSDHIALLQIDPMLVDNLKNNWVNQLLAQKESIEWVTMAEHPIPSQWAPSEEADHIVLLNNNGEWFTQLSYQTKQHASKWIVFNAPVDASFIQKAKTLGVPVTDLSAALALDLNWDTILSNQLSLMTQHTWKSGVQTYNAQELKELKIK
jgi:hypothetical protein